MNTVHPSEIRALRGLTVTVIGYGSQGRAHAMNLRDGAVEGGFDVRVGLRPGGESWGRAQRDGWSPRSVAEAVSGADVVMVLAPDMAQPTLLRDVVLPRLDPRALLLFAHGFAVHYGQVVPPEGQPLGLVAPKGPGALVRRQYEEGRGVPCIYAVERDPDGEARARVVAYANAIGGGRGGLIETTFAEETETDLFGEQAVLCGGMTELVVAGFETLVEAGYQPEIAYFECLHELKLIVDLLQEGGLARVHRYVSETAIYGDLSRGPRIVDEHVRARMKEVLAEVRDGTFARDWTLEDQAGRPRYRRLLQRDLEHPIETVGARLRQSMPWLEES